MNEQIKASLDDSVKKYYEKIRDIDAAFYIFFSMKYGDKRWDVLYGISPAYFTIVRKALADFFMVGLTKIFEKESRSDLNISKFIKLVERTFKANKVPPPTYIGDFLEFCSANKELIDNLITHRDKSITHHDKEYFIDESKLFDDAPLHIEKLKSLIQATLCFIGKINYDISNEITFAEFYNKDDYNRLIGLVIKAKGNK